MGSLRTGGARTSPGPCWSYFRHFTLSRTIIRDCRSETILTAGEADRKRGFSATPGPHIERKLPTGTRHHTAPCEPTALATVGQGIQGFFMRGLRAAIPVGRAEGYPRRIVIKVLKRGSKGIRRSLGEVVQRPVIYSMPGPFLDARKGSGPAALRRFWGGIGIPAMNCARRAMNCAAGGCVEAEAVV